MTPVLQDGEVRLRPVHLPDDIDVAWPWYQDRDLLDLSERPGTEPLSRDRVERMYRYQDQHGEFFIIEVWQPTGQWLAVGDVMLAEDTLPIVIGDARYRGRGIGRRVLALLIGRARERGWRTLWAKQIWSHNTASRRLFQSVGFLQVAIGVDAGGLPYERYRLDLRDPTPPGR
jgi:RimJ/RimL family protein N-acetyltransferase